MFVRRHRQLERSLSEQKARFAWEWPTSSSCRGRAAKVALFKRRICISLIYNLYLWRMQRLTSKETKLIRCNLSIVTEINLRWFLFLYVFAKEALTESHEKKT